MVTCIVDTANKVGYTVEGKLVRLNSYGTCKPTGYDTLTTALLESLRETTLAAIGLGLAVTDNRVADSVARVEYITGSRISEGYRNSRPGSCMRNKAHLHSVYKENASDVGLLTFKLANGIYGSLLCWTGKRGIYVDRLYSGHTTAGIVASGNDKALIVSAILGYFADKLPGIPVYSLRASDRLPGIPSLPNGKRVSFRLSLANNDSDEVGLPYCDTLCWARRIDSDTIILSDTPYGKHSWIQANSTEGTTLDDTEVGLLCCCNCNSAVNEYDRMEYHGDIYCGDCYYDNFSHCEYYEEYYPSNEVSEYTVFWGRRGVESVYLCDDALASRFTQAGSDSCVEYVHDDDRIEDLHGDYYYCPEDIDNGTIVELADGSYMLASEAYYCEADGYYYASEDDSPDSDDSDDSDEVAATPTPTPTPRELAVADSVTVDGLLLVSRYDRRSDEVGADYKVFHTTSGYILTSHSGNDKASAMEYARRFMEYLTLCEAASAMVGAASDIVGAFLAWNDSYLTFNRSFAYFDILTKAHKYAINNPATAIDYSTLAS